MNSFLNYLPNAISSLLLTIFLIYAFKSPAKKMGLIDIPGGRKHHQDTIPLIGGIAIFSSFFFNLLIIDIPIKEFSSLFAGIGILLITGMLDDLHDISAKTKLLMQLVAASIVVLWGGLVLPNLGNLFGLGLIGLGPFKEVFTILCIVTLINAINMIDGMDGLSGGISLVLLFALTFIAYSINASGDFVLLIMLTGACIGFLLFNARIPPRKKASVFLGDSGSMSFGLVIAWFAIHLASNPDNQLPAISYAWLVSIPVFDTMILMGRRIAKRRNPFSADREHIHHIFERAGISYNGTVILIITSVSFMAVVGIVAGRANTPESLLTLGFFLALIFHLYFVIHAWKVMKKLKHFRNYFLKE
jgi:UDP-GlcNAc:undecaprenyl-phosphate GlcNAc-1-phosphate transferase